MTNSKIENRGNISDFMSDAIIVYSYKLKISAPFSGTKSVELTIRAEERGSLRPNPLILESTRLLSPAEFYQRSFYEILIKSEIEKLRESMMRHLEIIPKLQQRITETPENSYTPFLTELYTVNPQ